MQVPREPQDPVQLEGGAESTEVSPVTKYKNTLKILLILVGAGITIAWIAFLSVLAANFVRSFQ
jgi:hypothetical protein